MPPTGIRFVPSTRVSALVSTATRGAPDVPFAVSTCGSAVTVSSSVTASCRVASRYSGPSRACSIRAASGSSTSAVHQPTRANDAPAAATRPVARRVATSDAVATAAAPPAATATARGPASTATSAASQAAAAPSASRASRRSPDAWRPAFTP